MIYKPKSEVLQTLIERGYFDQCTNLISLDKELLSGPVTVYVGYDCTADSLHVGSLLSIMMLRHMQRAGHKPIILLGGATTKIGDPSGRDDARKLLDDKQITKNMVGIKTVFERFLKFGDGPRDAIIVNNIDWFDDVKYISFLREFGQYFSVNRMLGFESVKSRLDREQPLSFLEFNYMILQAYDFLELSRKYNCILQMGGSDQWGNIVNGIDLARRVDNRKLFGLTCDLLTTSSGAKMGKTANGAIWLNADKLSAYDYWQFWRNTEDADVGRFLRLFTELPLDKISQLEQLEGSDINEAKKLLATEATTMLHGSEAANLAAETAWKTFVENQLGSELPCVELSDMELTEQPPIYTLLRRGGLVKSNGEARRLIKSNGVRLNDQVVKEETQTISQNDMLTDGSAKISIGRKRHMVVKII